MMRRRPTRVATFMGGELRVRVGRTRNPECGSRYQQSAFRISRSPGQVSLRKLRDHRVQRIDDVRHARLGELAEEGVCVELAESVFAEPLDQLDVRDAER